MADPPDPARFLVEAEKLIARCEASTGNLYDAKSPNGECGILRHAIWSEIIECPHCGAHTRFWDAAVRFDPLRLEESFDCSRCRKNTLIAGAPRSDEIFYDPILRSSELRRRREIVMMYGRSGKYNWRRPATEEDAALAEHAIDFKIPTSAPIASIPWGDLHRNGYHTGITHAHHFYTPRNWLAFATIWDEIENAPRHMRDPLRFLALSYNATHATLMTRVVVKKSNQRDFVLTGAQTGVLYVSSLPVEKNLFEGLRRKAKTIGRAFTVLNNRGTVRVVNASSRQLDLQDNSIDYVFTDPPFGGFIPYAELNFLNEIWLGRLTNRRDEIIVSNAQVKSVETYGLLMKEVFAEISRVLKDDGKATVVFHSAKADIWRRLQEAHIKAGLCVEFSSILDKLQGSFKQVNSGVSVRGDPLLLLAKSAIPGSLKNKTADTEAILMQLLMAATEAPDKKERTPERLYSRYVAHCMQQGLPISIDAAGFYSRAREILGSI